MANAIAAGAPEEELRQLVRAQGAKGITTHALLLAADGTTSYTEAVSARWL
jgi:hypothetical protein